MKNLLNIIFLLIFSTTLSWADNHKSYMGIRVQEVTKEIADVAKLDSPKGALVSSVVMNSPAYKAGIKPGDIILEIDGKIINTMKTLPILTSKIKPGRTVNIKIWLNEKKLISKNITIEAMPYKTGYFERKSPNQDIYPNVIEKAYYEKDCKKHGENITNYSKLNKSIFKGFVECNSDDVFFYEGIIETYNNGKLVRTLIYKEALPKEEVNKIGINIESIPGSFDWNVKRNAKGVLSGKILKGDIIKSFNDDLIEDEEAIFEFLNSKQDGNFIKLTIFRPKTSQTFNEKIKITKTLNKKFVALIKMPNDEYTIYPMVIKKMANQTTGLNKKTGEDLFLLTSLSYKQTLNEDFNKLYKYYDEVSKAKSSNLPEKPTLKSYFDLIKKIKN